MTTIVVTNVILPLPFVVAQLLRFLDIVDVGILVVPVLKLIFTLNFVVNSCFYVLWVRDFRDGLLDVLGCASLMRRLRKSSSACSRVSETKPAKKTSAIATDVAVNSSIKKEILVRVHETSI